MMLTAAYGLPRIGPDREYKRAIEGVWRTNYDLRSIAHLDTTLRELQSGMIDAYQCHVDLFPINEMTGYDAMIDTAIMVGRYNPVGWQDYYQLCRGSDALAMIKWFNTNYHYLVPDFGGVDPTDLYLNPDRPSHFMPTDMPSDSVHSFIGPYTFLRLSCGIAPGAFADFMTAVARIYRDLLRDIHTVWLFEPAFVLDLRPGDLRAIEDAYRILGQPNDASNAETAIGLFVHYDSVDFLPELCNLPVQAIGLDLVRGAANIQDIVERGFPDDKLLIAGLIDGRTVWRADIETVVATLRRLADRVPRLALSNAAPLFHLPVTIAGERLANALMRHLAFAYEKLVDIRDAASAFDGAEIERRPESDDFGRDPAVLERMQALTESDFRRAVGYEARRPIQTERFKLPLFPTTTIGSFPQTPEVRRMRARYRRGEIDTTAYHRFVRQTIADSIQIQERLGLDVLVHGENERTDMVEFFAEKMNGIAFTDKGWIISYGTRGYRPPIIYGDVSRPEPMTIREIAWAQQHTERPVKGMLTGPVTILAWSFVRQDIPLRDVAFQIALALQDEVADYERAGIGMIQIDEPAFREMAPNKRRAWDAYFDWATAAFRLCSSKARPETQIHSHMCYSDFNEIVDRILQMDFDVISIEATRSHGKVVGSFEQTDCSRQIGLGVYDIHSPALPDRQNIAAIIERAIRVIPRENFWINPDCGLKTRKWEEVMPALKMMVEEAARARSRFGNSYQAPRTGHE